MRRLGLMPVGLVGVTFLAVFHPPTRTRAAELHASATKERRYFNAHLGIGLEAPSGWSLSLHTGYANVLCTLIHPGGSRISLAVDRTAIKDAAGLFEQSRPGLAAQGLTVSRVLPGPRGGLEIDAQSARRNQAIRQLYLVRETPGSRDSSDGRPDRQAVVVTLTAPADQLAAATGPFEWVIAHLVLETPVRPEDKPDGGR